MIGIVDCNNFYVSCERVFNPKLLKCPVVVLSNNDGCVISRSEEAKTLGIKMGEPAFKLENFFKKNNVAVLSANFELYADMSHRVMNIITETVPNTEIYSVDEAFIDLSGIKNPFDFGLNLRKKILKWTGIPVSIGIAKTKTLSKVAVHFAKKEKKDFVLLIDDKNKDFYLKRIKIEDIWGIGKNFAKKLKDNFIFTAYDLAEISDYFLRKNFNINLLKIKSELKEKKAFDFHDQPEQKKSVRTGRTFGKEILDLKTLEEAFAFFADNVASKLREENLIANFITVYIRTNYHNKSKPQYAENAVIALKTPTNSTLIFIKAALSGLRKIFRKGYYYKKGVLIAGGLEKQNFIQTNLFDNLPVKHKSLMKAIDKIRKQYGKKSLKFGIQDNLNDWKSIRQHLSKPYTTDWNSILRVK